MSQFVDLSNQNPQKRFFRAFFVTSSQFSKVKCLIGFQQSKFFLLIIKKSFSILILICTHKAHFIEFWSKGIFCLIVSFLVYCSINRCLQMKMIENSQNNYFWACETSKTSLSRSFEKFGQRKKCSIFGLLTTQQRTISLKRLINFFSSGCYFLPLFFRCI